MEGPSDLNPRRFSIGHDDESRQNSEESFRTLSSAVSRNWLNHCTGCHRIADFIISCSSRPEPVVVRLSTEMAPAYRGRFSTNRASRRGVVRSEKRSSEYGFLFIDRRG